MLELFFNLQVYDCSFDAQIQIVRIELASSEK